jgi:hypothetical protein
MIMTAEVDGTHHTAPARLRDEVAVCRYDVAADTWWWSDRMYQLHGFEPGDIVPTTALILAHKHPDDRERVRVVLARAARTGAPFSTVHRIMDATGAERLVATAGEGRRDPDTGKVVEVLGYWVDVTPSVREAAAEQANQAIVASAANRAAIEQAKGVIAAAYCIDAEAAFEILRRASMDTNVPVRTLAQQVLEQASHGLLRSRTAVNDYLFGGRLTT